MRNKRFIAVILLLWGLCSQAQVFNRAPLSTTDYAQLPLGAIRAEGWLKEQLLRQANGLSGHLDEVYPQVMGPSNAWLGGDGDAWERGPYWIDGLLPLAYILGNEALIAKANAWVEAILASQHEDGYMGPSEDHPFVYGLQRGKTHDWWPKMVALKILQQYYMASSDGRVIDCLTRYFRYQAMHLNEMPLDHWSDWGRWRGADNLEVVFWLYNITGEAWLLELAEKIHAQSADWTSAFLDGDIFYRQGSVHCVNLAQGFKAPTVWWQYSHDARDWEAPRKAVETIRHTVGIPNGLWAGDEMLHWGNPNRGSELCTTVEMMFSLEEMLRISGDTFWADYLERVAYNALPAQINDDFTAKQYYQQTNQISCTRTWRPFSTPHDDTDVLFGTLNGYPCCLSNMHQGWPKFTQNLWYASADGGLAALVYAPSSVTASVAGGVEVTVTEQTKYPFLESAVFVISYPQMRKRKFTARFPLYFRVPGWCTEVTVRVGSEIVPVTPQNGTIRLERDWRAGDVIGLEFGAEVRAETWYDGAISVVRGPLVYALEMEENWNWISFEGRDRYYGEGAWEVTSPTRWNYCLMREKDITRETITGGCTVFDYPWNPEQAPRHLMVPARVLPHWQACNGMPGQVAFWTEDGNDTSGEDVMITLIPYGCTTLRIAAFPSRIVPWDLSFREIY